MSAAADDAGPGWMAAAGVLAGVVTIVPAGRAVGHELISDPRIDRVSFIGFTDAGRRIARTGTEGLGASLESKALFVPERG